MADSLGGAFLKETIGDILNPGVTEELLKINQDT